MFRVGDLILHSNEGVCRVVAVGRPDLDNADNDTLYYTLEPHYSTGLLYTRWIRPLHAPGPHQRAGLVPYRKHWRYPIDPNSNHPNTLCDLYKSCVHTEDCTALVAFIRNLLQRRDNNLQIGKKPPKIEDSYIKRAQDFCATSWPPCSKPPAKTSPTASKRPSHPRRRNKRRRAGIPGIIRQLFSHSFLYSHRLILTAGRQLSKRRRRLFISTKQLWGQRYVNCQNNTI